jgi:hypothetical protein
MRSLQLKQLANKASKIKIIKMKKRVVKLTESDLEKLVQRIIKEDEGMSTGVQKKTEKIVDLPMFGQLTKAIKSKNVDEQVNVFMTLLGQMDLKGNFGIKLKKAMQEKGLI